MKKIISLILILTLGIVFSNCSSDDNDDSVCSYCKNTGKCSRCNGRGYLAGVDKNRSCIICKGSGECIHCGGNSGNSGNSSNDDDDDKEFCTTCDGSGICPRCGGTGFAINNYPNKCALCKGTGECFDCNGEGYRNK
ncbi:hypothetical protein KSZ28_09585 [Bacteroides salyersiae]|jgi:hypothetical protein|uniref:hypothetical protein n=1 Tax=Bacteroides salyersiae TaxID=291644 RepID=UPI001C38B392|nr:hypothetical protein [Bacteroides salyersiae]MBV4203962.1 hypothetical protein [Bacteroides salyersiae]MCB6648987.1 hypothetical protein [Bacteroides salyersiae]